MASATTITAAIDADRPGLSPAKTQLLLFFCQGHHLADLGVPLFIDPLYATATGVLAESDEPPAGLDDESALNTVGYVLERYGNLSPADLRTLIQASGPWRLGRGSGDDARIEWAWLRDWFLRPEEQNDPDDDRPTAAMTAVPLR
jgi:uncharacterized phage-associated protein